MTFAVAWAALLAGLAFALWPVLRHRRADPALEEAAARPALESILEEIELDHASGRLSEAEAVLRRTEAVAGREHR